MISAGIQLDLIIWFNLVRLAGLLLLGGGMGIVAVGVMLENSTVCL